MRNISLNYFEFGPVVQEKMCLKIFLIESSGPLASTFICGVEPFVQF